MSAQMDTIVERLTQFKELLNAKSLELANEDPKSIDRDLFAILLSGVPSFRKVPGIPEHAGFDKFYKCKNDEQTSELRQFLKDNFNITNADSLEEQSHELFHLFNEYYDFGCEWEGHPNFSIDEIGEEGAAAYTASRDFALNFKDIVEEHGFLGWDIGERIMLIRASFACDLISEDDYDRLLMQEMKLAVNFFNNFIDYAISLLAGAVYFMFVNMGRKEEGGLLEFLDINMKIVAMLFQDEVWPINGWCAQILKALAIRDDQIEQLLPEKYQNMTAVASDRVLCEGYKIGVMVRQEPVDEFDSGWRFFAGDEEPVFLKDKENFGVLDLNLIINYSPDAIPHLDDPVGSFLVRKENDFVPYTPPENPEDLK